MFRIAIAFESRLGRHDGNPLYVTSFLKRMEYYGKVFAGKGVDKRIEGFFPLEERGGKFYRKEDKAAFESAKKLWEEKKEYIEIDHIAPTGDISIFGKYDLFLDVDWGEDGLGGILPYKCIDLPRPLAVWNSDTHLGYDYRLNKSKNADFVFCAQKRAVEEMKRDGVANPIWLPHAVEPLAYPKTDYASKKYDVCFIGNLNSKNRVDALDRLFREFPKFYFGKKLFEDAADTFSQSKIVFNISMLDDINMRTFEAMASGSFLLTNWIPTIEEFFEDGKHLALYRSEEEMIDKAKYYLAHDDEREKIAAAGYEEVIAKHTIGARVNRMLEEFIKEKVGIVA